MDPIQQLKDKLAKHPQLVVKATATLVEVAAPSVNGFPVSFHASSKEYLVSFAGWHEHFDSAEKAVDCFAFAFSGQCRVAITYRGWMPVKWVMEYLQDGNWLADSEVGLFLVPFWLRPRVEYKQNPHLLTQNGGGVAK